MLGRRVRAERAGERGDVDTRLGDPEQRIRGLSDRPPERKVIVAAAELVEGRAKQTRVLVRKRRQSPAERRALRRGSTVAGQARDLGAEGGGHRAGERRSGAAAGRRLRGGEGVEERIDTRDVHGPGIVPHPGPATDSGARVSVGKEPVAQLVEEGGGRIDPLLRQRRFEVRDDTIPVGRIGDGP